MTFQIAEPKDYECFARHQVTGVPPTTKIKLTVNIKTKYVNGSNTGPTFSEYDDKTISFDPATTSFPVSIVALAPDTKNPWNCEVNILGTQCAECANGYGIQTENTGNCVAYTFSTNPLTYQAAKPRWQGTTGYDDNAITQTVKPATRIPNVPNSCNCTVN